MKRKSDFVMKKMGGVCLLVPLGAQVKECNAIITLNDTAACIWELLSVERSLDELTASIAAQFDVTTDSARTDLLSFIDELKLSGLLE